jgi:glutathione gamma-glutamylcysteinyltransferase
MTSPSFYRRPLPEALVPFASADGRTLFREALTDGTMEGYFAQAEQFHTQQEPAFCGLATLVVALNALAIDPGRLWKGPWRWYSEELLDCCAPLDKVKNEGITFDHFACLARCNGAAVQPVRAADGNVARFRESIVSATTAAEGEVLAIAYARRVLGQTGDGHFSTIAGYHRGRDLALVLDVARFKYPPHWAPVAMLFDAMLPIDEETKRSRGWLTLRRGKHPPLAYRLAPQSATWKEIVRAFEGIAVQTTSVDDAVRSFLGNLPPPLATLVEEHDTETPEHRAIVCSVAEALRKTDVAAAVRRVVGRDDERAAVLLLLAPDDTFAAVPAMAALRDPKGLPEPLRAEITRLREQLGVMTCS